MTDREKIKEVLARELEPMFQGHRWLANGKDWINADYYTRDQEGGNNVRKVLHIDINKLADALIPLMPMRHES